MNDTWTKENSSILVNETAEVARYPIGYRKGLLGQSLLISQTM